MCITEKSIKSIPQYKYYKNLELNEEKTNDKRSNKLTKNIVEIKANKVQAHTKKRRHSEHEGKDLTKKNRNQTEKDKVKEEWMAFDQANREMNKKVKRSC